MRRNLWSKIESLDLPKYISENDICIYARDYISGQDYDYCETNQYIHNFKKSGLKKKEKQWWHRNKAIETFRDEVNQFFISYKLKGILTITAIPSSKIKSSPEYNNRFEDLFTELKKLKYNFVEEWPVKIKENVLASHKGGARNPELIKQNYIWEGFEKKSPQILFVFDDLITTGAHFRAMSDFLKENGYTGQIIGVFWARATEDDRDWKVNDG